MLDKSGERDNAAVRNGIAKRRLTGRTPGPIPRLIGAGRGSGPGAEASSDKRRDWPAGLAGRSSVFCEMPALRRAATADPRWG